MANDARSEASPSCYYWHAQLETTSETSKFMGRGNHCTDVRTVIGPNVLTLIFSRIEYWHE